MDECDGQAEPYPSGSAHQSKLLFKKIPSITGFPEHILEQFVMPSPNITGFLTLIFVSHALEYRQAGVGKQEARQIGPSLEAAQGSIFDLLGWLGVCEE